MKKFFSLLFSFFLLSLFLFLSGCNRDTSIISNSETFGESFTEEIMFPFTDEKIEITLETDPSSSESMTEPPINTATPTTTTAKPTTTTAKPTTTAAPTTSTAKPTTTTAKPTTTTAKPTTTAAPTTSTAKPTTTTRVPTTSAISQDPILSSLVPIDARENFTFRYDLTNQTSGELSPIENDYYLSAYKVTNAQYARFISETGRKAPSYWKNGTYPEGKADHPVLNIAYSDAIGYCQWLSSKYEDWTFRLPTEAEWENAAMGNYYGNNSVKYPAGSETPSYNATTHELTSTFNFNGTIASKLFREYGSQYPVNYIKGEFEGTSETLGECISINANGGVTNWANHGGSATKGYFLQTDLYATISANGGYTTPVTAFPPNSLGLYDMAGNCWDITSSIIVAENGLEKGVSCYAIRGGSWYATARSCTFSYRGEGRKDSPSSTVGFRIAADYTPQ